MQLKRKIKALYGHIQQEMYHKMKKTEQTLKFSTWTKAKHELYPLIILAITLVPRAPMSAPCIIKEPLIVPTPGGK